MPIRILIKTTIPATPDDWHVGRFSLVADWLRSIGRADGEPHYEVIARDRREGSSGDDCDLQSAAQGEFQQVWLIATDVTGALTPADVSHLQKFREKGGGLFLTRDHQNLGSCLTRLGALGLTQNFQTNNPEEDASRHCCDDLATPSISWPNYHSGANGDLQIVQATQPLHAVMRRPDGTPIHRLPAHPHEGTVSAPLALAARARVIATGRSQTTGKRFNLCVAVEEDGVGRALSDSSFHHLADYNWNPRLGAPSFVDEPPGEEVLRDPTALEDVHTYVANAAAWLAGRL